MIKEKENVCQFPELSASIHKLLACTIRIQFKTYYGNKASNCAYGIKKHNTVHAVKKREHAQTL